MSFLPAPGSIVRIRGGTIVIITKVTPEGDDDRAWDGVREEPIRAEDITEIIHETDFPFYGESTTNE